jgi:hypothetical protein
MDVLVPSARLASTVVADESVQAPRHPHGQSPPTRPPTQRARIGPLITLLLLVNLAASLYQLPVNRVVERRLCREYYLVHDPSVLDPDGFVREELCKNKPEVQEGLAWIQGFMETIWIVGGQSYSSCDAATKSC